MEPSYNMESMLKNYTQYMTGDQSSELREEKDKLADLTMKVIARGVGQFTVSQENALLEFSKKHAALNPNDKVVQLTSVLSESILASRGAKEQLPSDIKGIIETFKDISSLKSLSDEEKQKVAVYATVRLLNAGTEVVPINYSDLTKFTKIITICWKDLKNHHKAIVEKLIRLTADAESTNSPSVQEFIKIAKVLIVMYDTEKVPTEILNHPAYHGDALEKGFSMLQESLTTTGQVDFSNFVMKYLEDHLMDQQYLIRNSSTVPSKDEKGFKTFTITVSTKALGGKISQGRIQRTEDPSGKVVWVSSGKNYKTLNDLIKDSLQSYAICYPPSVEKMNHYITNKYLGRQ